MNLKTLLFIAFILLPLSLFSQWGAKVGLDYGTLTGTDLSKYRIGFHAGATYDIRLYEKLYLQPALLLSLNSVGLNQGTNLKDGKIDRYYLGIPVNLSFRPGITENSKFVIDLGLYAKYGLFGNSKYWNGEKEIKESTYKAFNRFDCGINIGAGIEINKMYFGISYQLGFTSVNKELDAYNNQIFRASLGYKF
jgi:hypothetical protein